jgi:hypothetical protein
MSSVTALRRAPPPPRSPERQSLALAIETRDTHRARIVSLQAAIQRIGFVWRAEETVTAAREGIEEARRADSKRLTDAVIANTPPPPSTVPAARRALEEVEDALANLIATKATLEADIAALQSSELFRDDAVTSAVSAVLLTEGAPTIAALVTELDGLHHQMIDRHHAPRALESANGVIVKEANLYTPLALVSKRYDTPPAYWNIAQQPGPLFEAWRAAIAALKTDANAPLPA